ncbi:MAG: hypothetical protein QOG71_4028 [Pyrinomonadaceae bacterium]|nr:hypothetical protein [Pyrinomonadaceae bacterium]
MSTVNPEMKSLKTRLKAMWMTGDFGQVAKHIETDGTTRVDGEYLEVVATRN